MKRLLTLAAFLSLFVFAGGLSAQMGEDDMGDDGMGGESPKKTEKPGDTEKPKDKPGKKEKKKGRKKVDRKAYQQLGRILKSRDSDRDRKLNKEELNNDELFKKLDTNEDGFIDLKEMLAKRELLMADLEKQEKAAGQEEFEALDRDDSGSLTAKELGKERASWLVDGDKNDDKSLDLKEYLAVRGPAKQKAAQAKRITDGARKAIKKLDKDGDGKLTGDEIPERMRSNLEKIDTDGDGSISEAELEVVMRKQAKARGGEGRRHPGRQDRAPGDRKKKNRKTDKKKTDKTDEKKTDKAKPKPEPKPKDEDEF